MHTVKSPVNSLRPILLSLLTLLAASACDEDSKGICGPGSGTDAPCCEPPAVEEIACPDGQQPVREGDRRAVCIALDPSVGFERPIGPFVVYESDGTVVYGDRREGGDRWACDALARRVVAHSTYTMCEEEGFCECVQGCWDEVGASTPCWQINAPGLCGQAP